MKILFKMMMGILLVIMLLFVAAHFWPDGVLRPETENLLRLNTSLIPPEQNAYFTFYGMDAPLDRNAHAVGYEKATALNLASAEFLKTGNHALIPDERWGNPPITKEDDEGFLCKPTKEACFDKFFVNEQKIRSLTNNLAAWLARYKSLYQRPRYHHAVMPSAFTDMGLPNFVLYLRLHRLLLAEIGCDYLSGNKADALTALQKDISYLRGVFADINILITRVFIIFMLRSDLHLYAQMLDMPDAPPEALTWNIPLLAENERTLEHVMRYEFGIPASIYDMLAAHPQTCLEEFKEMPKWEKMLLSILPFKRNATLNLLVPAYLKIVEMSHLSAPEVVRLEKEFSAKPTQSVRIPDYFTNPAGIILYRNASPDFTGAVSRTHALDGLIRLVNLKQRILAQRIPDNRILAFLQEQAAEYGDPYTGQAMQWNADRRTIGFLSPFKAQTYIDELRLPESRQ